jgi:hypothetical protein
MANTQRNNAPFLSQQNYPAVAGTSTAPFTDERAVTAGGGGGGTGNVTFEPDSIGAFGELKYYDNIVGQDINIPGIVQENSNFSIGADNTNISAGVDTTVSAGAYTTISAGLNTTVSAGNNLNKTANNDITDTATNNITTTATNGNININAPNANSVATEGNIIINANNLAEVTGNLCGLGGPNTNIAQVFANETLLYANNIIDVNTPIFDLARDPGESNCILRLNNSTNAHIRILNAPSAADDVLVIQSAGATPNPGSQTAPWTALWQQPAPAPTYTITYSPTDTTLALLKNGTPVSTATFANFRTAQVSRVVINQYGVDLSIFGLNAGTSSPDVAPAPSSALVGNNPPMVPANSFFIGASFRLTASGRTTFLQAGDRVNIKVWSNRGQSTEVQIGTFNINVVGVNTAQVGWKMYFEFTIRDIGTNGQFAGNGQFLYSDDAQPRDVYGADWMASTSPFNTTIAQYFDVKFQLNGSSNNLAVDLAVIERIF